jgi:hypothetical protein
MLRLESDRAFQSPITGFFVEAGSRGAHVALTPKPALYVRMTGEGARVSVQCLLLYLRLASKGMPTLASPRNAFPFDLINGNVVCASCQVRLTGSCRVRSTRLRFPGGVGAEVTEADGRGQRPHGQPAGASSYPAAVRSNCRSRLSRCLTSYVPLLIDQEVATGAPTPPSSDRRADMVSHDPSTRSLGVRSDPNRKQSIWRSRASSSLPTVIWWCSDLMIPTARGKRGAGP